MTALSPGELKLFLSGDPSAIPESSAARAAAASAICTAGLARPLSQFEGNGPC